MKKDTTTGKSATTAGTAPDEELAGKTARVREIVNGLGRAVVAFSGGADSTLLLALAAEELGAENVLAAVGVSPVVPVREIEAARRLAKDIGVELVEFVSHEMDDPAFTENPADRCYHCKTALYAEIGRIAKERGFDSVASGANADDLNDFRPGHEAGRRMGVRNPLMEAGLTKADIRAVSRSMGLPTWDKPALACLASRIPYGSPITPGRLDRIARAEEALRGLGFEECRVRDYETLARIEVPADHLSRAIEQRREIVSALTEAGYTYVTLDLAGLRSGSMNEVLP